MEPERKIETWLRAYAKKRRGQAGDSFKLDPATRRILQNEISGSAPARKDDDEGMSLWEVLRRNWAFFLGFAVCIFILASFFFETFKAAKTKELASMSTQSVPENDLRQIPGSAQRPLANSASPVTNSQAIMLSDNVESLQRVPGSKNQNTSQIAAATRELATESSTSAKSPASVLSQNSAGQITNETFATLAPPKESPAEVVNNASASAPATAPSAPETAGVPAQPQEVTPPAAVAQPVPAGGFYATAPAPVNSLQTPEAGEERKFGASPISGPMVENNFMNMIAPTLQGSRVLMNFRVVQTGSIICVVDQDGSLYKGMLHAEGWGGNAVTESAAAQRDTAAESATTPKVESPRRAESDQLGSARPPSAEKKDDWYHHWPSGSLGGNAPAAAPALPTGAAMPVKAGALPSATADTGVLQSRQIYYFRVSGMNRTLNQPVMFMATLTEDLAAMKSGQANQAGQLPWSNLRIAGMAVVNRTNQIQINAAPVTSPGESASPK